MLIQKTLSKTFRSKLIFDTKEPNFGQKFKILFGQKISCLSYGQKNFEREFKQSSQVDQKFEVMLSCGWCWGFDNNHVK